MDYFYAILVGYFIGSFQTSYFLGKFVKKIDIRNYGTKNAGASNATIVFGWKYGIITAIIDIGKTILAVFLISLLFPYNPLLKFVAGVCSILGHIYPFYMKFRGGKGFASYTGLMLAVNWKVGLIFIILCIFITIITDYIVISTLFTIILYPIYNLYVNAPMLYIIMLFFLLILIAYKHRTNIIKIINHEERGLRDVLKSTR